MERTSTRHVVRGLVGAVLVAALVVMWLGFVTLLEGNLPPFPETS
jgi:heme O synthase-like polyprenyltransferase